MSKLSGPLTVLAALSLLFLGALTTRASAPPPTVQDSARLSACPVRFDGFRDALTWYSGPNRVLIEARSGCTTRMGSLLTLEGVKVTFQKNHSKSGVLYAAEGQLSLRKGLLQIAAADARQSEGFLRGVSRLVLDLRTGELRAPGMRMRLGGPNP